MQSLIHRGDVRHCSAFRSTKLPPHSAFREDCASIEGWVVPQRCWVCSYKKHESNDVKWAFFWKKYRRKKKQNDEPSPRNGSEHVATFGNKRKTKRSFSILNLKGQGLFAPRALCCPLGARALFHMQPLDSPPPGFFSILRAHVPASVRLPCRMTPAVNATMRRTVARGSWDLWILLGFNWARELKRNLGILLQAETPGWHASFFQESSGNVT